MKISVILAHPDPKSFNAAIALTVIDRLTAGRHEVFFHDLYQEHFDPVLYHPEFPKWVKIHAAIEYNCREISQTDRIIVIHPN